MYTDLHRCRTTHDSECGSAPNLCLCSCPFGGRARVVLIMARRISGGEPTPGRQRGSKSTELLSHLSSFRTQYKDKIIEDLKMMTAEL